MQHIPIYLDDLSCEAVIILYYKYKVLYLDDLSCEAVIILCHKYMVLYLADLSCEAVIILYGIVWSVTSLSDLLSCQNYILDYISHMECPMNAINMLVSMVYIEVD